jgi:hypothetical protein
MNLYTLDNLIGDTPVSEQLGAALERMASKDHTHPEYADINEVEELRKKIDMLLDLVGDVSVADQIAMALENNK